MSGFVGATIALVLGLISALHGLWALGVSWPIRNEKDLARAVVGAKGIDRMPPKWASLMVAISGAVAVGFALHFAGFIQLPFLPIWMVQAAGFLMVVVFLARGLASYTAFWARITPEQPFRSLDRKIFGPLCLALGAGYAILLWGFF